MLKHIRPSVKLGIFGHFFNDLGNVEVLYPLKHKLASKNKGLLINAKKLIETEIDSGLLQAKAVDVQVSPDQYRGTVHILFNWQEIQKFSSDIFFTSILTFLLGILAITFLATLILYRTVLQPLGLIREVIHRQYKGERGIRVPDLNEDELGELGHAFNNMLNAISLGEEKILHQAHFDTLTDIPNRFLSLDRLNQLIKNAKRKNEKAAVMFLDLDEFKKVNDTLGHDSGDKLLIEAGHRLSQEVRQGDTVGRLGGDEFIVLLAGLAEEVQIDNIASGMLERLRRAFFINDRELMLTASIGIALYPENGETVSELLRNADIAMYHSKAKGRNIYSYFSKEMSQSMARKLALEEQMHAALERNEFYLLYQPKIDLSTHKVMGVEALLRWQNSELGYVGPDEFIPIAEETGLIVPIGRFIFEKALAAAQIFQTEFLSTFSMAINISPRQLYDDSLVNDLMTCLNRASINPETVELEITEGILMKADTMINETIENINHLGLRIAMDDFGTGYSSLSYLRQYPFDVLKIDRSFVNDISDDRADYELVSAAVAMGHGLNLKVVAEGVETKEQSQLLSDMGCDFALGYYFSKPVSLDEMKVIMESADPLGQ